MGPICRAVLKIISLFQADNPEDCPVCLTGFNDTVQRPRTMPCGHTVCTLCIDKLKEQFRVICPECRVIHFVPMGGQFPVCYTVEALIRKLRGTESTTAVTPLLRPQKSTEVTKAYGKEEASFSKKMCFILQEQATFVAAITVCQDFQSQLDQYQTALMSLNEKQQQLEARLQKLVDESRNVRELMQREKSRAAAKKEELKEKKQELQTTLKTMFNYTGKQKADLAVTGTVRLTGKPEQVVGFQESFPRVSTSTTIIKVRVPMLQLLSGLLVTVMTTTGNIHSVNIYKDKKSLHEFSQSYVSSFRKLFSPSFPVHFSGLFGQQRW